LGVALLAWALAARDPAKAKPDASLKACGQALLETRIKEDYAGRYALLEPKMRRQTSLTTYIRAQGPLQYLEARVGG
jgi:hypothetical protein